MRPGISPDLASTPMPGAMPGNAQGSGGAADGLQAALAELATRFPERTVATEEGIVSYREAGAAGGPTFLLLHGIGSGAASWLDCALELARHGRVIAWNAPGYGKSAALASARPGASAYALRLRQLVQALELDGVTLAGHSLGAMMAAAYAAGHPARLQRLVLLSPARGYGLQARLAQGAGVLRDRLSTLGELGIPGMATQRSARLLSPGATATQRDWVRWNMAQLHPGGYTQAVHLLCGDAIENYAQPALAAQPGAVLCGSEDTVTTPEDSRAVATLFGFPYAPIAGAGHACYVEQPAAVARAILGSR